LPQTTAKVINKIQAIITNKKLTSYNLNDIITRLKIMITLNIYLTSSILPPFSIIIGEISYLSKKCLTIIYFGIKLYNMNEERTIQRHVLLPESLDQKIRQLAKKKDMKITAIIRQAIKEFLEMQRIREKSL